MTYAIDWTLAALLLGGTITLMALHFDLLRVTRPNVVSVFFIFHVLGQVVPAAIFFAEGTRPHADRFFWTNVLVALLIPLGGVLGNLVLPRTRGAPRSFFSPALRLADDPDTRASERGFLVIWFGMSLVLSVYYLGHAETVPLRTLFFEKYRPEDLLAMRYALSGGQLGYLVGLTLSVFMPALFALTIANWGNLRGLYWRTFALVCVIVPIINNAYATKKTPIGIMLFLAIIVWLYFQHAGKAEARRKSRMSRRNRILFLVAGALLIAAIFGYPLLILAFKPIGQKSELAILIFEGIVKRLFFNPATNSYFAFALFPEVYEFTWFRDIGKVAAFFGRDYFDLPFAISYHSRGYAVSAPPAAIGNFYAQAGWPGVVVGTLLAAAVLKGVENMLLSSPRKSRVHLVAYAFLMLGAFRLFWAYFHGVLLSESIVPALAILALYKLIERRRRPRREPAVASALAQ